MSNLIRFFLYTAFIRVFSKHQLHLALEGVAGGNLRVSAFGAKARVGIFTNGVTNR